LGYSSTLGKTGPVKYHNTRQNYLKFEEVSPYRDSGMVTTTTISKG
jgi:hypothetical protein